jgi:hypothetical protein
MQKWEFLFVFAAISSDEGEFRPRFANDEELNNWQAGPTLYEYANQLGDRGWELLASNPVVFIQSKWQSEREAQSISSELRAIEMVFKRPKKDESVSPY